MGTSVSFVISDTISYISAGKLPPFVSHRTTYSVPASCAVRITFIAYSLSALYPSKKCSASNMTFFPFLHKYSIDSLMIARFSSGVVPRISFICSFHAFPNITAVSALHSFSTRKPGSFSAVMPTFLVLPNEAILECFSLIQASLSKSSASFILE